MTTAPLKDDQLDDIAELVSAGPVDLGAYTQAELMVVLGQTAAFTGVENDVLAEAVRSLAARGLLFREPGQQSADIVGDLGLVMGLVAMRVGALEIRRGHPGPPHQPWRWLVSLFPHEVVGIDRVDALGLHRLSLVSVEGLAEEVVERLIDGKAGIPAKAAGPIPVGDEELRRVSEQAPARWQLIFRVPRADGTLLVVDALLLRSGPGRMDLVTKSPDGSGHQRVAIDRDTLHDYLLELIALR